MAVENNIDDTGSSTIYLNSLVKANPVGASSQVKEVDNHLRGLKNVLLNTFTAITGAITATHTELNKLTGYVGNIPLLGGVQAWTKQQYFAEATLTDAASIAWDLDVAQAAKVTLTANRALANPTNKRAGATYVLRVIQDATGSRTLTFGTNYKFPGGAAPVLTTTAAAVDVFAFYSDGVYMYGNAMLDVK